MMRISAVRIFPFETRESGGRTLAYAEIEIDGSLLVRGLRVMEARNQGLFIGFPAQRARRGRETLVELVVPLTTEARRLVRTAVIQEYNRVTGREPAAREKPGTSAGPGAAGREGSGEP